MEFESIHSSNDSQISEAAKERQRLNKIMMDDIVAGKQVDGQVALKCLFLNLYDENNRLIFDKIEKKMEETENAIKNLETATDSLEKENKKLKDELINTQILLFRNKILVRGLPQHPGVKSNEKESYGQTSEVFKDLMTTMKVNLKGSPVELIRYPQSDKKKLTRGSTSCPIVSASFGSSMDFNAFMNGLRNLNGVARFKDTRIDRNIPPVLRPDYDRAQKKGYELRKRKMQTKVIIAQAQGTIKLFAKKPTEKDFKEHEY